MRVLIEGAWHDEELPRMSVAPSWQPIPRPHHGGRLVGFV